MSPPAGNNQGEWDAYLDSVFQPVRPGYRTPGELIAETRRQTVSRPTETDALLSMMLGRTVTMYSDVSNNFTGTDTAAYSKPTTNEKEVMFERGFKWCSGTRWTHEPQYIPLMDFWRNNSRGDGLDHLCMECRKAWNAKEDDAA